MRCPQKTAISGSVEILERNKQSLLGALFHIVLPPPLLSSSPNSAIIIRRLKKNPDKRGGKGMLSLGCLPHWGREGVTLLAAAENTRVTQKKRISTKPFFYNFLIYPPIQSLFFSLPGVVLSRKIPDDEDTLKSDHDR